MHGNKSDNPNAVGLRNTRTRNKQKFSLTPNRFLCILFLGILVSRLCISPSFSEDKVKYIPTLTTSENRAFGDILPGTWQQWLAKHDGKTNQTEVSILKLEPTSLHSDWGCGISLQFNFETRDRQSPIPSSTKAFFKASHADMFHYDAESHLREVKAYYLDRILQTNVVLPCVGYILDRRQVPDDKWSTIASNLECIRDDPETRPDSAEGSMMLWMNGLEGVSKETIVESTRKNDHHTNIELESAMNYALFHYLGACMKSEHNHFSKELTNTGSVGGSAGGSAAATGGERTYVAIDNDRCLTPKAVFSNRKVVPDLHFNRIKLWETLVYERICRVPHQFFPVVGVVLEAANAKHPVARVSSRLKSALETDVLAHKLFESQPEAFEEIDERIQKLADYINQNCPGGGGMEEKEQKLSQRM